MKTPVFTGENRLLIKILQKAMKLNCNTFRDIRIVLFAIYYLIFIYLPMQHESYIQLQLACNTNGWQMRSI